jgi:cation transport ATPase
MEQPLLDQSPTTDEEHHNLTNENQSETLEPSTETDEIQSETIELTTETNETQSETTEPTTETRLSSQRYQTHVGTFLLYTLILGYTTAIQPSGSGWRFFSWHPFLMILGFVAMMGTSVVTKKLGGYKNTKLHGMLASGGLLMTFGGLYVIYRNKELMGKEHITSTHAVFGIITMSGCIMAMLAGGIFLHPDFGVNKTNTTIR